MNSRQKRSNGGYGLRRKIAKKRLDEDFEYYFSKIGSSYESKTMKGEDSSPKVQHQELITEHTIKANVKNRDSPERRPRGRPRKVQVSVQNQEPDISETNLKFVDLKEKRCRKPKVLYIEQSESAKAVNEICVKADHIVNVSHEVEVDDGVAKRLKLEAVLSEEMTELREEEVSSLPEGEKENLPEEGVSLDSFTEERIIVPLGVEVQCDSGEGDIDLYEEEPGKALTLIHKAKRKYRRNRLSQDTIRKLSELSPEDKIECNECHKLLKPSSFRQHLRTHTGEKPFGCEVCNARFTRKGDVERHVRIVHNKQKPFKCCRCQRAFGDKKNLRWHLMNHDKKLFYVCEVCGFKFGKREYWENHVRFIHPLPGGLDPSEAEDIEDDRLQALTDSLLEDDESIDEPQNSNSIAEQVSSKLDNFVQASVVQRIPVECKVIKNGGFKSAPLKTFPNLVKVSRPKGADIVDSSNVYIVNEEPSAVNAVVIQINDMGSNDVKPVLSTKMHSHPFGAANYIHVVAPKSPLPYEHENSESDQPIIINTQQCSADGEEDRLDVTPDSVLQVQMQERNISNEFVDPDEPTKVISIVMNSGGDDDGRNNGNMQNLIEVLLDAASGHSNVAEISQKT